MWDDKVAIHAQALANRSLRVRGTVAGLGRGLPKLTGAKPKLEASWAVFRARRASLNRLWIGDSHASFFAGAPLQRFAITPAAEAVVWLGPRLMYSLSREGFPDPLLPELRRGLELAATPIALAAGEIDCRVHLVERLRNGDTLDFVAGYVERAAELRLRIGAPHVFLVGPVPPSDFGPADDDYPRNGTMAERVAATRKLEAELCEAVLRKGDSTISVLPLGTRFGDPDTGALARRFTLDGCHVNALGSRVIREALSRAATARPSAVI